LTSHDVLTFNTFASGLNQAVRAKTTGSHVALSVRNSGTENNRELFKGSKDLASPLVCNEKKILVGGAYFL